MVVLLFFVEMEFGGLNVTFDHASFLHSFDYNYRWNNNNKEEVGNGQVSSWKMHCLLKD